MNRDEKNLQTRQKIIDSALLEFGEKSYGEASLNTVCAAGNISKGIIYHYFKDKDELYLICVRECFDALTGYLADALAEGGAPLVCHLGTQATLERYFDARIEFFSAHPLYLKLFCNALMNAPAHLAGAIDEITSELNAQSVAILSAFLKTVRLRQDVSAEEVIEVFCEYQDFVNARFQMKTAGESTLKEHEERCKRSLQILLYGVIERGV